MNGTPDIEERLERLEGENIALFSLLTLVTSNLSESNRDDLTFYLRRLNTLNLPVASTSDNQLQGFNKIIEEFVSVISK